MLTHTSTSHGLRLPLITPFRDDTPDETSSHRLIRHYARAPIDGLILAATTREDPIFYGAAMQGADGGILASAHVRTRAFAARIRRESALPEAV
jgi:dihydrodipicolinate synthase/N-acetylneuraminate lyase